MINVWCDEYTINLIILHVSNTQYTTISMCWLKINLNDKYCQQNNCFCFVFVFSCCCCLVFTKQNLHGIESISCHGQATLKVVLYLSYGTVLVFRRKEDYAQLARTNSKGEALFLFLFPSPFPLFPLLVSMLRFQCRSSQVRWLSSLEPQYQQQRRALIDFSSDRRNSIAFCLARPSLSFFPISMHVVCMHIYIHILTLLCHTCGGVTGHSLSS